MTRDEFQQLTRRQIVILDGATGTELIKHGLPAGVCPEAWCMEHPEAIESVQAAYMQAGANIVYTPTFGGNRMKLAEFGLAERTAEINRRLAQISRNAVKDRARVFGDLAPTGQFLQPLGAWDFEEAVKVYLEQARALADGGVDGFVIETMMDLQEARAALIAIRSFSDLPVMVSLTFEPTGRTLTGTDPAAALVTLQSLGADAFGCNCSTGPREMAELIARIKPFARIPLIAKPNAGVPQFIGGRTVFDLDADGFSAFAPVLIQAGAGIVGGCCGTTPAHIAKLADALKTTLPPPIEAPSCGLVASSRKVVKLGHGNPFAVIGERINPTGKKALQAELRAGSTALVRQFAEEQTACQADLLDVNVGLSGIDERAMMIRCVEELTRCTEVPLCIDSTHPEVVEAALRLYPGRALLNSISAERERLEKVLPIAAKYGAMLILLPLTDAGIPATAPERIAVVEELFARVQACGYLKADICVDALVMTVSANPEAAAVTLDLIEWCHRVFRCPTVCGLSNVSFGLPARPLVNQTFLGMALGRGLDMAIANPQMTELINMVRASDILNGRDVRMERFLTQFAQNVPAPAPAAKMETLPVPEQLRRGVLRGDTEGIGKCVEQALSGGMPPAEIVQILIDAITVVGEKFDRKEYFLPQLIMSADAMRKAMGLVEPLLARDAGAAKRREPFVLATVKGDIHDIGKNIVGIMLRNYGFDVIDLGKDVSAETILDAAELHNARLIGLSALMTTTMTQMPLVIAEAKRRNLKVHFIVGGAVVDREFADEIGAKYAADALATVREAQNLLEMDSR